VTQAAPYREDGQDRTRSTNGRHGLGRGTRLPPPQRSNAEEGQGPEVGPQAERRDAYAKTSRSLGDRLACVCQLGIDRIEAA